MLAKYLLVDALDPTYIKWPLPNLSCEQSNGLHWENEQLFLWNVVSHYFDDPRTHYSHHNPC
jgi:hypothetical protein